MSSSLRQFDLGFFKAHDTIYDENTRYDSLKTKTTGVF